MATLIEKNTKKLIEHKLDALFAKQQALNGNKGDNGEQTAGLPQASDGFRFYQNNPYKSIQGQDPLSKYYWDFPNGSKNQPYRLGNVGVSADGINNPTIPLPIGTTSNNLGITTPRPNTLGSFKPNNFIPDESLKYNAPNNTDLGIAPADMGSLNNWQNNNVQFSNPKDNPTSPDFKPTPAGTGSGKLGKLGSFAAQISPMLYNMAKGLQKPAKTQPTYNPYEGSVRSLMANRRFNIEPLLNSNLTAQAVTNRNISNTANSRGEMMSNLGASQNYRMNSDASAWAQKNNMDNQYMAEQAQMDYNLGNNRAQTNWNTQIANEQNKAATNQFMGQGFNDLGQFAQMQQLMGNQKFRDSQLASLYPDMYSQIYQFQPAMQKIIKAAGGAN